MNAIMLTFSSCNDDPFYPFVTTKLFAYHGAQLSTLPFPTLFEASWAPAPPGTYTDRPQSPERIAAAASGSGSTSGGGPASAPVSVLAPKASGYVPPHLRGAAGGVPGAGTGGGPKPQFSLAFDPNEKAGRVVATASSTPGGGSTRPASSKPLPPGAEPIVGEGGGKGGKKKGTNSNTKKNEAPAAGSVEKPQKPSGEKSQVEKPVSNNTVASEEGGGA